MPKYRVLSIDGGGIRGIVAVTLLRRLAAQPALASWLAQVDLIAGTSTGGLIALGIAKGLALEEIRDLYVTKGQEIFDDSWLDDVADLGKVIGADYTIKGLKRQLRRILGEVTLGELQNNVLIAAFDLDNSDDPHRRPGVPRTWKPKLFHNFRGENWDGDVPAWQVGLYTAAAPTYFPSVDGYIDGGVYANNPAMCALAQALDSRCGPPARLDEVALLSLGTGTSLRHIPRKNLDWGYAQWAKPLVSLMLDGIAGIADYQCAQLLGDRYHRLAPQFPEGTTYDLDEHRKVLDMERFAEEVDLAATASWLEEQWL